MNKGFAEANYEEVLWGSIVQSIDKLIRDFFVYYLPIFLRTDFVGF